MPIQHMLYKTQYNNTQDKKLVKQSKTYAKDSFAYFFSKKILEKLFIVAIIQVL